MTATDNPTIHALLAAFEEFVSRPTEEAHARLRALSAPDALRIILARTVELEAENDKLRAALAEKVVSQTALQELSVSKGTFEATFEGGAVHLLADALAEQFADSGATNYLEMQFDNDRTGPLVLTMQRLNGKTPAALRREAEAERDARQAEAQALSAQLKDAQQQLEALRPAAEAWQNFKARVRVMGARSAPTESS